MWFNRFIVVAEIQGWNDPAEQKNTRLQGPAGEFVYGQLSHHVRVNYGQLVQELQNRS